MAPILRIGADRRDDFYKEALNMNTLTKTIVMLTMTTAAGCANLLESQLDCSEGRCDEHILNDVVQFDQGQGWTAPRQEVTVSSQKWENVSFRDAFRFALSLIHI